MARDPNQIQDISEQEPDVVASLEKEMTLLWREMRDEGLVRKKR